MPTDRPTCATCRHVIYAAGERLCRLTRLDRPVGPMSNAASWYGKVYSNDWCGEHAPVEGAKGCDDGR